MFFSKVIALSVCIAAVAAIAPFEEFHVPKPYSFGYAIKDKHGEQHRQEIGDGLHSVKGSYGFKDERGIERQVNYVADKGGFRAEVKTNEPGTAALNPASVKMESSAHPYFGMSKGPIAAAAGKEGLALASGFEFPEFLKLDEAELAKGGLAFDAGLAKENELEKEALSAELMKQGLAFGAGFGLESFAKGFPFAPAVAEESFAKEAGAAGELNLAAGLGLEELFKEGFALVPLGAVEKATPLEKEGLALEKSLNAEEMAKMGLLYSPLFAKESLAFLKQAQLEKTGLGKLAGSYPFVSNFEKTAFPFAAPLPYAAPKPQGFTYGGPLLGGMVKGYDARFF